MAADTYVVNGKGQPVIDKDPDATLDYSMDWSAWLAPLNDTIATADIITDPSLTLVRKVVGPTSVVAWLSGGIAPTDNPKTPIPVTFKITTTNTPVARVDERTLYLRIIDR